MSPLKRGPTGDIPKHIYKALMGSYTTYLKLEQAASKKQSTIKQMSRLVNATVNAAGHSKKWDDLTRKLQKDTANHFEVGKANVVEQRRIMWTTSYNLDVWFSTWKDTLINLGFAREKELGEEGDGELAFFPGQKRRIGNVDETDGSIDDTTGQRGGRPPMTFFSPDVAGGATAVNKSGHTSTIICGSNADGEPFPPHFQLKTLAQSEERERTSIQWFVNCKDTIAQFGHSKRKAFPCTFGMNEKAGMNSVELDKYMDGSILPLYPDVQDKPGKRVIMKLDSGPGRMNVEMLAALRLKGIYLVPGVPNTTGKTQETDQNYGPFKGMFRGNVRDLSQARFDRNLSLQVTDLPLLVFGGTCQKTGVVLNDAFSSAFSVESNLACWKKCGSVPLTRAPVFAKDVRREVPVGHAAAVGASLPSTEDPELEKLKSMESMNQFYCGVLDSNGYDGSKLRKDAPKRKTHVAVTQEHSAERVLAIKKAKTAGQMFYATGGSHVNSDSFFRARALASRSHEIKELEEKKTQRGKYCKEQRAAVMMLKSKGDLNYSKPENVYSPRSQDVIEMEKNCD